MFFNRYIKHAAIAVALGLTGADAVVGEIAGSGDSLFVAMPSVVAPQIAALGDRVRRPGKEKITFVGQYVDPSGSQPALVTYQIPGLVRLEGFKPGSVRITFDGERSYGSSSAADDAFLETFTIDTVEGMLASTKRGASLRLLGRQFQPHPKNFPKYAGPRYDIYEVAAAVPFRQDQLVRLKRYYFDSKTGWLVRTRYRDLTPSRPVTVEIHFSDWQTLDGSAYPGRIDRYENGQAIFSFVITNISAGPRVEPAAFR
jgi:hypothetical protein